MKKRIIALLTVLAVTIGLHGCDDNLEGLPSSLGTQETETEQPEDTMQPGDGAKISFDLPEGWERHPETMLKARWPERPNDSAAPDVVLSYVDGAKGTEEDAKKMAEEHFNTQKVINQEELPTLQELEIAGTKTYIVEVHTNSFWGDYWWNTTVFFAKDGYVAGINFGDRIQNQKNTIEMLISSYRVSE